MEKTERDVKENDPEGAARESRKKGVEPGKEEGVADIGTGAGADVGSDPDLHHRVSTAVGWSCLQLVKNAAAVKQ